MVGEYSARLALGDFGELSTSMQHGAGDPGMVHGDDDSRRVASAHHHRQAAALHGSEQHPHHGDRGRYASDREFAADAAGSAGTPSQMIAQIAYRATDGTVVFSPPVGTGMTSIMLTKPPKNGVLTVVITNITMDGYKGAKSYGWDPNETFGYKIQVTGGTPAPRTRRTSDLIGEFRAKREICLNRAGTGDQLAAMRRHPSPSPKSKNPKTRALLRTRSFGGLAPLIAALPVAFAATASAATLSSGTFKVQTGNSADLVPAARRRRLFRRTTCLNAANAPGQDTADHEWLGELMFSYRFGTGHGKPRCLRPPQTAEPWRTRAPARPSPTRILAARTGSRTSKSSRRIRSSMTTCPGQSRSPIRRAKHRIR